MANIISTSKIEFEYHIKQEQTKLFAKNLFAEAYQDIDRLSEVFDNTSISNRNLCVPISFFENDTSFENRNNVLRKLQLRKKILLILFIFHQRVYQLQVWMLL